VIFDLSGRRALVTGAGQGIGEAIATMLAGQGAAVVINDVVPARAAAVADRLRLAGADATAVPFDVTDRTAVFRAVNAAELATGPVDILVNNAGNGGTEGMVLRQFRDMEPDDWEGPLRVNLYGTMHCTKAVTDGMCSRGWGRVITVASIAGTIGTAIGVTPYSAAKGGAIAFTRSLAMEVAGCGVTANSLAVGYQGRAAASEQFARGIPVGRAGTPEDVAAACVWLASNEAAWVTAQTIGINGGSATS
jgi:NAD(P)-dependent dehydrogenase (short-subunit alcohol dehydrogenase family)